MSYLTPVTQLVSSIPTAPGDQGSVTPSVGFSSALPLSPLKHSDNFFQPAQYAGTGLTTGLEIKTPEYKLGDTLVYRFGLPLSYEHLWFSSTPSSDIQFDASAYSLETNDFGAGLAAYFGLPNIQLRLAGSLGGTHFTGDAWAGAMEGASSLNNVLFRLGASVALTGKVDLGIISPALTVGASFSGYPDSLRAPKLNEDGQPIQGEVGTLTAGDPVKFFVTVDFNVNP